MRSAAGSATIELTDTGRATHRQAAILADARRRDLVRGLTEDQYVATVRVLEHMAENIRQA
ncbi:hypothetical protein D5S18_15000 [Nocardia panacis]|uniref:MarR family transcriptional regulator n=1 Tax=Nocardia panacis TaxID=2340916 RepID=A0A3A4KJF3_9NOCA|nr:hypothetical protein [Nocardia panacis]RJO74761.1 hypothetical protein D5S18_15000 [Nocardia panacis]